MTVPATLLQLPVLAQLLANGLIAGGAYALVAVGIALLYSTTRFFNFMPGAVFTASAYAACFAAPVLGPVGSVACAAVTGAVLGWASDSLVFRSLRARRSTPLISMLASFGVLIAVQGALAIAFTNRTRVLVGFGDGTSSIRVLGAYVTPLQLATLAAALVLLVAVLAALKSRWGLAIRAVSMSRVGASVVGIDAERVVSLATTASCALVGVAGVMVAAESGLEPSMGFAVVLKGMIAVVIGGMGSIVGAVLAGLSIGLVENAAAWWLGSMWRDPVVYTLLLAFLLLRPKGIRGEATRRD